MLKKLIIIALILALAGATSWWIIQTKPQSQRKAVQKIRPLVNVAKVAIEEVPLYITALGTVKPVQETFVRARVAGQVENLGAAFDDGGIVQKGALLLQLDDANYKNTLRMKESALEKAKAALALEMGQQSVARAELKQLQNLGAQVVTSSKNSPETSSFEQSPLALRSPQLAQAKAAVQSAAAECDQAALNVQYATLRAPYNALVVERKVSVGSQANTSDTLAHLVGIDEYRVEAAVPLDKLAAKNMTDYAGMQVVIDAGAGQMRKGTVLRALSSLDDSTRMGRILISVKDPLGQKNGEPTLFLGNQVKVQFSVGTLQNVVVLPRQALHAGNTVWVALPQEKDTVLDIRRVDIVWKDAEHVYVKTGLKKGDRLVISALSAPMQSMPLRIAEENNSENIRKALSNTVSKSSLTSAPQKQDGQGKVAERAKNSEKTAKQGAK